MANVTQQRYPRVKTARPESRVNSQAGALSPKLASSSAEHCHVASTRLTAGGHNERKSHAGPAPGELPVYTETVKVLQSLVHRVANMYSSNLQGVL